MFEVATRCRQSGVPCYAVVGGDALDAFGKRLLNIEVEAAATESREASADDVQHAARRLAKLLRDSGRLDSCRCRIGSPRCPANH